MLLIDLVDDTFVDAAPQTVAERVHDPGCWARWWPGLELVTSRDRGLKGRQWVVTGRAGGKVLAGTAEIWLEPWGSGVLVHHYLRLDPVPRPGSESHVATRSPTARWADRQRRRLALRWKREVHRLKDDLEATPTAAGGGGAV